MGFLFRDKRFLLAAGIALLAFVVGFWTIPPAPAVVIVKYAAFWVMLLTFALFVKALAPILQRELGGWRLDMAETTSLLLIALCGLVLLVHESYGFKILMDEVVLNGASMSLHFDKTLMVPFRGHDIQGAYVIIDGYVDKRPIFFPFLVSLLHDLTGYRPENAFVLNTGLTFVLLLLAYAIGKKIAGRFAGLLLVLLLTSLPLLAQNCTGAGFELLNLVMILASLYLGVVWLEGRDETSLTAFLYAGILHKVFDLHRSSWELFSRPGHEKVFSSEYFGDNLAHALSFFFDYTKRQSNSLLLSIVGSIALPFFLLSSIKRLRVPKSGRSIDTALIVFGAALAASFLLMMFYFWGQFDDPVIRRLSLPSNLLLALAVVAVIPDFIRTTKAWRFILVAASLAILLHSLPVMATHAYTEEYLAGRETSWRQDFMKTHPERDYLMIDTDSILWVINRVSSTPVPQARLRKESLVFHWRNHTWSDIYVFQRFVVDPGTNKIFVRTEDDLGPDFVLEPVVEKRMKTLTLSRISRVVSIKGDNPTATPPSINEIPGASLSASEREKVNAVYWNNWLKNLP